MATSITTLSGRRCTVIPRTQFFTATSTSAATETAGLPDVLSSFSTSTIQDTPSTSLISTIAQSTDSNPVSSITSLATTILATSTTITAAAATLLPAITSSSADPSSTQTSPDDTAGDSAGNTSKKNVIAAAIGASLGAVAVVALVILCAYFRRRKRRTSTQFHDREKGPGMAGRFPGVTNLLDRCNPGPVVAYIPAIIDKVRPVFANLRNFQFMSRNKDNDSPEQSQPDFTARKLSVSRPDPQENSMQGAGMSSAPRTITESANPFADPPSTNTETERNNTRSENPFADSADPFSHTDYEDEIAFSMPLTIRNGGVDDDDMDATNNGVNNRDRNSARSTLSGSTLNIPNTRSSSPLVHEFYSRPPTWKSIDRKSMKTEDRSSTYSDPFDLERPPTIHSSAHPTPMVERQKSQKGGYFADLDFNFPRHVS